MLEDRLVPSDEIEGIALKKRPAIADITRSFRANLNDDLCYVLGHLYNDVADKIPLIETLEARRDIAGLIKMFSILQGLFYAYSLGNVDYFVFAMYQFAMDPPRLINPANAGTLPAQSPLT